MAWIESHQALRDHPKVRHLARLLGVDNDSALGKLHRFWYWCIDYAEDGDLRKHGMEVISDSLGYDATALITARWADIKPYIRVHDWWDWSGRFFQSKYKNAPEKWQRIRSLYQVGSKSVLLTGHIPTDLPTKHNLPTIPTGAFDLLWAKYPRREGKKAAERHFKTSVINMKDWLDIQNAMENYVAQLRTNRTEMQFTKQGSTWFNNWRDYVDYKVVATQTIRPTPAPRKLEVLPNEEDLPTPDFIAAAKKDAGLTK